MAEAVGNISECERGSLHTDEDFAALEFLELPDNRGYRVIGTNFTNAATPLLRYDVGDVVSLPAQQIHCSCGRPGRIVVAIDGRQEDYVILKSGARIGRLDHIFKDMVHVREAQIYQRVPGRITVRIVRVSSYSNEHEVDLLRAVRERVGIDTAVEITYVDQLERTATGKLRVVVSELTDARVAKPV
jgi:phenylacetate-CoA ligase